MEVLRLGWEVLPSTAASSHTGPSGTATEAPTSQKNDVGAATGAAAGADVGVDQTRLEENQGPQCEQRPLEKRGVLPLFPKVLSDFLQKAPLLSPPSCLRGGVWETWKAPGKDRELATEQTRRK